MQRLFGFPAPFPSGNPALFSLIWFAAILELAGGLLLLAGLLTRSIAFIFQARWRSLAGYVAG